MAKGKKDKADKKAINKKAKGMKKNKKGKGKTIAKGKGKERLLSLLENEGMIAESIDSLKYGIRPIDESNWKIYETKVIEKGVNKGKEIEVTVGYYPKLPMALLRLKEVIYKRATMEVLREKPLTLTQLNLLLLTVEETDVKMLKIIDKTLSIYGDS